MVIAHASVLVAFLCLMASEARGAPLLMPQPMPGLMDPEAIAEGFNYIYQPFQSSQPLGILGDFLRAIKKPDQVKGNIIAVCYVLYSDD